MKLVQWFNDQLQASAEGLIWGFEQVPVARRNTRPPDALGEWNALRHIFHMIHYEKTMALPGMRQWLGGPFPPPSEDEDVAWGKIQPDPDQLLAEFRKIRSEQITLLPKFDDAAWTAAHNTIWGQFTLLWVVSKTYQHTAEHTSDILKIALFWDRF